MTNDRPYRRALARAEARRRISSCAGSEFDPGVVRAVLVAL
jgi:HD-GYP domain-containing protein (c-di-GMP phosphodiesterase class II)